MLPVMDEIALQYDRTINVTRFAPWDNTKAINEKISYSQFLENLKVPKVVRNNGTEESINRSKKAAGGFVGGYVQDRRKNANTKSRSLITIDIDEVEKGLNVWEHIECNTNFAVAMYSTYRHTKINPRYRVIIPLLYDIEPRHYEEVTRYLVGNILNLNIDETSYEFGRQMYLPVCSNQSSYEFYYRDAPFFDASFLVQQQEEIETFKKSQKPDPRKKKNWVGAWTNIYSITDVLDNFLADEYEHLRGNRYSYTKGTTPGGLVIHDDDTHAHCHHESSPISGKNVNSFDLFRLHKFGHLDKEAKRGKITDMPSYKAMIEHCKQDEKVRAFYQEHIKPSAVDDFSSTIKDENVHPGQFFNENNKFLHHEFACFLAKKENIIRLDDRLHVYSNGRYIADDSLIKRKMIAVIPTLKETQLNEVMARLKLIAKVKEHAPSRYIGVKNGVYDLKEDKLLKHGPEFVITNQINANYDPAAKCEHIDSLFKTISDNDPEVERLLKEMIGYTLFRENFFEKSFLLKGEGGNGKSTLFKAIYALLGEENISAMSLSDLGERFNTGMLHGKLANIGDDIPYTSIKDTSVFKKLSTGDLIKGEFKGEMPFQFRNFAKLIFSTNRLPRLYDNSQGLKDRLVIVPLNARIRGSEKQDPFFEQKITTEEARSYLLNIGIEALQRLLLIGRFTLPEVVQRSLQEFDVSNNPVVEWLHEYYEKGKDIHNLSVSSAYKNYKTFCEYNHYKHPLSKKALTTELEQLGYISTRKSVDKKQVRVYWNVQKDS